jgi:hypothetical protein
MWDTCRNVFRIPVLDAVLGNMKTSAVSHMQHAGTLCRVAPPSACLIAQEECSWCQMTNKRIGS